MITRGLENTVDEMLDAFRVVYLTGPRQAGKSTLAKRIADQREMDYLSLDDAAIRHAAETDPHGLVNSIDGPAVIDEFQYAPELVHAVKLVSDGLAPNTFGKFLLTGSSDIFKSARVSEALPGHMARLELWPLARAELTGNLELNWVDALVESDWPNTDEKTRDDIAQIIIDGGYPEPRAKSGRAQKAWFDSYVQGRILKDFEEYYTARGDYVGKLNALVPYLAGRTANLLKYASVSNDLDLNDHTVRQYIDVLEQMFILRRLSSWSKNPAKRATTRMSKAHMVDTGLACHLLGISSPSQLLRSQYYGSLFETFVFTELFKHSTWSQNVVRLYHYRDKRKNEVDLVMELSDGSIIGIECKASQSVGPDDFKGLHKLAEFAGDRFLRGVVLYTGTRVLPFNDKSHEMMAVPLT